MAIMTTEFLLKRKEERFAFFSGDQKKLYLYPNPNKEKKRGEYVLTVGDKIERGKFSFVVRHKRLFLKLLSTNGEKFLLVVQGGQKLIN